MYVCVRVDVGVGVGACVYRCVRDCVCHITLCVCVGAYVYRCVRVSHYTPRFPITTKTESKNEFIYNAGIQ